ncbi:MAG: hypothetical protein AAF436_02185 [Myxococcota bacterium]
MTRSTRVALLVTGATIAVIVLLARHGRIERSSRILEQLPHTAVAVVRIDGSAIADGPMRLNLLDSLSLDAGLDEIGVACDFDPRTSIEELTVWAGGAEGEPLSSVGLLLRGRGDVDAEALARCYQALVERRGSTIDRRMTPAGPVLFSRDGRSALAAVDDRTVVTGSGSTVAEFLAAASGKAPALFDDHKFNALWSTVGTAPIAGAFVAPPRWRDALARLGAIGDRASALADVEAVGFTLGAAADGPLVVWIDVDSPATAEQNAALMKVWVDAPPEEVPAAMIDIARRADIETRGSRIRVVAGLRGPPSSP